MAGLDLDDTVVAEVMGAMRREDIRRERSVDNDDGRIDSRGGWRGE